MVDTTVCCDLPFEIITPDVMVVTVPRSRLSEMAELVAAMFSPEVEGSLKEKQSGLCHLD